MRSEITSKPRSGRRLTLLVAWLRDQTALWTLMGATLLWLVSLRGLDARQLNELSWLSPLPVSAYLALLIMTLSFGWTIVQRPRYTQLLLLHVLVLVVVLFGTPAFFGTVDALEHTGTFAQSINAHLDWPGFFVLNTFLTEIAGPQSSSLWTTWSTVCFQLLYLGPLLMLMQAATHDQRLVWLSIWFYYLASWIGQANFSPQTFTYFFYLVSLALLLHWFKAERPGLPWLEKAALAPDWCGRFVRRFYLWSIEPAHPITLNQGAQSGLIILIVILCAVMVSSHLLTAFVVLVGVGLLVLLNRCRLRHLPLLIAIMLLAWLVYMATDLLSDPRPGLRNEISVGTGLANNVNQQVQGNPKSIALLLAMPLLVWGSALFGGLRRLRKGQSDMSFVLLMLAPFTLLGLQRSREMYFSIYLFSLPFAVFFASALFYPTLNEQADEAVPSVRPNRMKRWLWPLVIIGLASASGSISLAPGLPALNAGLRLWVTLGFLLICPGMAFVRLLRLPSALSEWTLAFALSLALSTLVPELMEYTVRWSPEASLALLLGLSLIGALLQLLLRPQEPLPFAPTRIEAASDSERNLR